MRDPVSGDFNIRSSTGRPRDVRIADIKGYKISGSGNDKAEFAAVICDAIRNSNLRDICKHFSKMHHLPTGKDITVKQRLIFERELAAKVSRVPRHDLANYEYQDQQSKQFIRSLWDGRVFKEHVDACDGIGRDFGEEGRGQTVSHSQAESPGSSVLEQRVNRNSLAVTRDAVERHGAVAMECAPDAKVSDWISSSCFSANPGLVSAVQTIAGSGDGAWFEGVWFDEAPRPAQSAPGSNAADQAHDQGGSAPHETNFRQLQLSQTSVCEIEPAGPRENTSGLTPPQRDQESQQGRAMASPGGPEVQTSGYAPLAQDLLAAAVYATINGPQSNVPEASRGRLDGAGSVAPVHAGGGNTTSWPRLRKET